MNENPVRHLKRDGGSIVKKKKRSRIRGRTRFSCFWLPQQIIILALLVHHRQSTHIRISVLDMYYYMVMVVVDIIVLSPARLLRL